VLSNLQFFYLYKSQHVRKPICNLGKFSNSVEIAILGRAGNSCHCVASVIHCSFLNHCWYFVNSICVRKNISRIPAGVDIFMVSREGNSVSKISLIFCKLHVLLNYLMSSHLTTLLLYSCIIVGIVIIFFPQGLSWLI